MRTSRIFVGFFMMHEALVLCFAALAIVACDSDSNDEGDGNDADVVPTTPIDRSGLTDVGTAPLDYSDPALWLCRPGNDPNECHADLDATEFLPDGTRQVVPHERAEDPGFDCFYVYPTVDLTCRGNVTDFSDVSLQLDPLLSQAARFTRICEVYAPLYRQISLCIGGTTATDGGTAEGGLVGRAGDFQMPIDDVQDAFQYYIDHLSKGRNFVLIGHSQGTFMLTALVQQVIENNPELRARMISALLIGGQIEVPVGQRTGATFTSIPTCEAPGETGCVVAYNSFAAEAPPPDNAAFGKASAGNVVACTNPSLLADNPGRYRGSYSPMMLNNPIFVPTGGTPQEGVTTPFSMYRDFFRGACVQANGFSYLEISADPAAGDLRPVPPYRNAGSEAIGFGLHIADFNLELDDLIDTVDQQAAAMR